MFEREVMLNQFLLGYFKKVIPDIPADQIGVRPAGNGHPPIWLLGHLALCAEIGDTVCGDQLKHPEWVETFGPGTCDDVSDVEAYSKDEFVQLILDGYSRLQVKATQCNADSMYDGHGLDLLKNSPIKTRGDLLAHLLTTHFSFHLAQLSAWRRAAGHPALF